MILIVGTINEGSISEVRKHFPTAEIDPTNGLSLYDVNVYCNELFDILMENKEVILFTNNSVIITMLDRKEFITELYDASYGLDKPLPIKYPMSLEETLLCNWHIPD